MKRNILITVFFYLSISLWAYDFSDNGIYYNITSSISPFTAQVTFPNGGYQTGVLSLTIPATVTYRGNTYSITSIGEKAFENYYTSIKIYIPSTVTSIGDWAFAFCTALRSINIPSTVTSIGTGAFCGCSELTSVNSIPLSVISIGRLAFYNCRLTSIKIPPSVSFIGIGAFGSCSKLSSITVDEDNLKYSSQDGILLNKMKSQIIQYPPAKSGNYNTPTSVISVGDSAFYYCNNLTSVNFSSSLLSIGNYAFYGCNSLASINIPKLINSIGNFAFGNCSSLISISAYPKTPIDLSKSTYPIFDINKTNTTLFVPIDSKKLYQNSYEWKDFTNIVEFNATATPEVFDMNLKIYPTNITDAFHVSGITGLAFLQLYDMQGRQILTQIVKDNESVPVSTLPKGLYIVRISGSNGVSQTKLMKK